MFFPSFYLSLVLPVSLLQTLLCLKSPLLGLPTRVHQLPPALTVSAPAPRRSSSCCPLPWTTVILAHAGGTEAPPGFAHCPCQYHQPSLLLPPSPKDYTAHFLPFSGKREKPHYTHGSHSYLYLSSYFPAS